jgi:hemolysin activation/secretion protein
MKRKFFRLSLLAVLLAAVTNLALTEEQPLKPADPSPVEKIAAPSDEPGAELPAVVPGGQDSVLPELPDPNDPNAAGNAGKPEPKVSGGGSVLQLPFTRLMNPDYSETPLPLAGITLFADRRNSAKEQAPTWEKAQKDALREGVRVTAGLMTPKPDDLRAALGKKLGKIATFQDLQDMVEIIEEHYRDNHRPMTHVYIPKQSLFSDRVVISIVEGRVGETVILTEADLVNKPEDQLTSAERSFMDRMAKDKNWWNSWYSNPYAAADVNNEYLTRAAQLKGRIVDPGEIEALVTGTNRSPWVRLNRPVEHPFRDVGVNFSPPGDDVLGTTNLAFEVRDRRPLKFFTGVDNSLTEITGENRFFLGTAWYDAFLLGKDHMLGAQIFSGLEPDELAGVSFNYMIPWQNAKYEQFTELYTSYVASQVAVTYGDVPTDTIGGSFILGGRHYLELPEMWGATDLTQPLLDKNPYPWAKRDREARGLHHEVGGGFDFKMSDNNLEFGGSTVSDTPADIVQLVLEYNARQTDPSGETSLFTQLYISPGDLTGDNTTEAFQPLRYDADAAYVYARLRLEREQDLPFTGKLAGMMLRGALTGQYSSANLLASEQLGLGGFNSVRGYPERALRGDLGWIVNLELFSPEFHPCKDWFNVSQGDMLRFLAFADYAHGEPVNDSPSDPLDDPADLMSVGLGMRYEFNDNVRLRLDYGFRLEDLPVAADNEDSGAVHFGLIMVF